jgi:hypothetical protein
MEWRRFKPSAAKTPSLNAKERYFVRNNGHLAQPTRLERVTFAFEGQRWACAYPKFLGITGSESWAEISLMGAAEVPLG